ncbi:MAG: GGDEF domain-containing protein [Archangiaceae bacterium]|nr:GGDEF domain-containing protein [Archangiaceae bacterium]
MFRATTKAFDRITALAATLFDAPLAGIVSAARVEASQGEPVTDAMERLGAADLVCTQVAMEPTPHARFFAAVPLLGPDSEVLAALYVADVRVRQPTDKQLQALRDLAEMATVELRQQRMAKIVTSAPQMVFVQDAVTSRVTYLNDDAVYYASGRFPLALDAVHPGDRAQLESMHTELSCLDARAERVVRVQVDGMWRWLHVKKRVSRCDSTGAPLEHTGVATDVTEAKETEARLVEAKDQLEQLATQDELTQIPNKRALNTRLQQLIAEGKRGRRFAVVMADVDNFKKVNDTFGHAEGDRVLREVAKALTDNVREIDFVARFGGEEFCVLLTDVDGPTALRLAERLREAVERLGGPFRVTCSFGVAPCASNDRSDVKLLLEGADDALYRAKDSGRNRVAMARRSMPSARPARKHQRVAA